MRLHFVVEGHTEETFVRDLLGPDLAAEGIYCDAHRVTTGRRGAKVFRGGLLSFAHMRKDLELWMKQDTGADAWFTTMVDLYRLPADFPGVAESRAINDPLHRAEFLETRLLDNLPHERFMPYIQVHEFEALLFSDPPAFLTAFPGSTPQMNLLVAIRDAFPTPEHIDDGHDTAPSKRILGLLSEYDKAVAGPLIARHIGLAKLRQECSHFNRWIERLKVAGQAGSSG